MERIDALVLTYAINVLWQAALVVAAGLLGERLLQRAPARLRYLLWVAVVAVAVILPLASLKSPGAVRTPPRGDAASVARTAAADAWLPFMAGRTAPVSPATGSTVTLLFGLSAAFQALRLGRSWVRARRIVRGAHPLEIPDALAPVVAHCRAALRLPDVEILGSPDIVGPVTVGALRPLVLLPSGFLDSASPEELAAALSHEMAHVRRRDYAVHLMTELLLLPIAFHPAAWCARRRLAEAREMACDEAALETRIGARAYARSLLSLAASAAGLPRPSTTLGVLDAHTLEVRMKRILDSGPRLGTGRARATLGAALLLLAGLATAASLFPLRAVATTGKGDLAPFVGTWRGDWPIDFKYKEDSARKPAVELEIRPDGSIVETWYAYLRPVDPNDPSLEIRKNVRQITRYEVWGKTLTLTTHVEGFKIADYPPADVDLRATVELQGSGEAVYKSLPNPYVENLKKRGQSVPPPPPAFPLKRLR
jgi:beta-lactamase regulating signal transducer with metallopeptidase domain